jgi:hypothetical protein
MELANLVLIAWASLVFWVLGQIWFGQIVVYPLFALVGEAEYTRYHTFYSSRIPLPVIIPGFASFLFPLPLAVLGPALPAWMTLANLGCGVVGLLVTVLLEIPRHARLARKRDASMIDELIRYNWPRTLSITAQAFVTVAMLHHAFGAS